ncbi:MAG: hypothetical protein KIT85_18130 [Pseudolabrys sp.]|nr:hypothetical protein [Pseudolabrys sp.]
MINIPDYVPEAVRAIAPHLMESTSGKRSQCAERLLINPKMKSVWRQLLKQNVEASVISTLRGYQRLRSYDLPERDFTTQQQACSAFYAYTVIECTSKRTIGVRADADLLAEHYLAAARITRGFATEFRHFVSPDEALALDIAADCIEREIKWQHTHLLASPYIVGQRTNRVRSFKNLERATVRVLAVELHRLFGSYLLQTVGTVATVALDLKKQISKSDAKHWCAHLDRGANKGMTKKAP